MDNIPTPFRFFSTAISSCSHLYCAWQCNFSFRNPRNFPMPQRINAPMRQCCAFAMCQCMNVSMFRCQCFNVQTINACNAAIANWIERSVSPPRFAIAQCCTCSMLLASCTKSHVSPLAPIPNILLFVHIIYSLHCINSIVAGFMSHVSCPLCHTFHVSCVSCSWFLRGLFYVIVYHVPRLLFPLTGFVSLVLCPMSPRPPPVPSH